MCSSDLGTGTLPSEAQWEYAARGSMNRPWPWGDAALDVSARRVCAARSESDGTCPEQDSAFEAGSTPSPDGVWHLVGNVSEWTADLFAAYGSSPCWGGVPRTDPVCMSGVSLVYSIRGGSWDEAPSFLASGARTGFAVNSASGSVGFRCASR